jgi:hypothetical protein
MEIEKVRTPAAAAGSDALGGEPPTPGGDGAGHAGLDDGAGDVGPVVAEVSLAADEGDLAHAEFGHLAHHVEALLGGQLVGPRPPRPGAAVVAGEVAAQRDLPDHVGGLQR